MICNYLLFEELHDSFHFGFNCFLGLKSYSLMCNYFQGIPFQWTDQKV